MSKVTKLGGRERFQPADFAIGRYAAKVPDETTIADVMHPEYFCNHLASIRPGMTIDVLSDDMKLDCTLRVLSITKTTAKVRLLRLFDPNAQAIETLEITAPKVSHGGPAHKWRFTHDGEIIEMGFDSKEEAEKAAATYFEQMKGA
ncbi:MAG: hypothetical protein IBJ07_12290 [Rhizobiaceae bacterium]|nr:hypothetical protein [Rhizobiaceae bacterium]